MNSVFGIRKNLVCGIFMVISWLIFMYIEYILFLGENILKGYLFDNKL